MKKKKLIGLESFCSPSSAACMSGTLLLGAGKGGGLGLSCWPCVPVQQEKMERAYFLALLPCAVGWEGWTYPPPWYITTAG